MGHATAARLASGPTFTYTERPGCETAPNVNVIDEKEEERDKDGKKTFAPSSQQEKVKKEESNMEL